MKKFLETSIKYSIENTSKTQDKLIELRKESRKHSSPLDMYEFMN